MSTTQITIKKTAHEQFEFSFYRDSVAGDLHEERSDIVKLMDEATDALMRLPQKLDCNQLNSSSAVHRITISVGGNALNK